MRRRRHSATSLRPAASASGAGGARPRGGHGHGRGAGTAAGAGADYVVIGGLAARLHGSPSLTEDLDLTPECSEANLRRLAAALAELGARLAVPDAEQGLAIPLDERTFSSPVMTFVTRAGLVDVNLAPAGIGGYEHIARRAVDYEVAGVRLRVAALQDIIRSKEASARPKDRAQLEILRDLADELERRGR